MCILFFQELHDSHKATESMEAVTDMEGMDDMVMSTEDMDMIATVMNHTVIISRILSHEVQYQKTCT